MLCKLTMASVDEASAGDSFPTFGAPIEKADSEYECDLMIEALTKELTAVRNQLAFLTHHLDRDNHLQKQQDQHNQQQQYRQSDHSTARSLAGQRDHATALVLDSYSDLQAASRGNAATTRKAHGKRIKPVLRKNTREVEGMTESEVKELHRHYLQVVDQTEKERWEARKRCLVLMQAHIEQQLQKLQERAERFQKKVDRIKGKERAERLKLKPPRFKSTGIDDTAFLAKIPQSTFYKIVGLEHKLKTEGKLRTLTDLKEFWDHMLAPTRQSTATPPSAHLQRPPSTPFTLQEEEEEEYSDSWAITALPPQHSGYSPRRSPLRMRMATPITPSTPDSLRFIPMKIPQFKSVNEVLGEEKPSWNVESDCHFRAREVEVGRRKLYHMYQRARTHEMIMQRLLPEVPQFKAHPVFAEESDEQYYLAKTKPEENHSHQLEQAPILQQPLGNPTVEMPESKVDRTTSQLSDILTEEVPPTTTSSEASSMHKHLDSTVADRACKPILVPLTMDTAMSNLPIRESKHKSALWTNYLMARGCS